MGLGGLSQSLWLLIIFPPLQHRFGTGNVMRFCACVWPFFYSCAPICNVLLKKNLMAPFWVLIIICQAFGSGVAMSFSMSFPHWLMNSITNDSMLTAAIQLAINDISPSRGAFGTLNALALALVSGIRAFAPILFSSLFATGVRLQIANGELVWLILIGLTFVLNAALRWLPEKAEGRPKQQTRTRENGVVEES